MVLHYKLLILSEFSLYSSIFKAPTYKVYKQLLKLNLIFLKVAMPVMRKNKIEKVSNILKTDLKLVTDPIKSGVEVGKTVVNEGVGFFKDSANIAFRKAEVVKIYTYSFIHKFLFYK